MKKLINKLYNLNKQGDAYLDTVPSDIRLVLFDNKFTESLERTKDLLIKEVFKEYADDINWLLYDFKEGEDNLCVINNKEVNIKTVEDFLNTL